MGVHEAGRYFKVFVVVVQLLSRVWLFAIPWTAACQASLSFTISWSLLRVTSIESVIPSNHLILYCPLLLHLILPSIGVFSSESALRIRWPKYWSFTFSTIPSNEYWIILNFLIYLPNLSLQLWGSTVLIPLLLRLRALRLRGSKSLSQICTVNWLGWG